jgi:hypothetical protein
MSATSPSTTETRCQGHNKSNRHSPCYNRARPGFHTCGTHRLQEESIIAYKEAKAAAEAKKPAALWVAIPAETLSAPVAAFLQAQLTQMLELQKELADVRYQMENLREELAYVRSRTSTERSGDY